MSWTDQRIESLTRLWTALPELATEVMDSGLADDGLGAQRGAAILMFDIDGWPTLDAACAINPSF